MENVVPPFKVDVAGTFLLPAALREAREQYRNEQISLLTLRAVEDAEIRNLVDRLKAEGLKVSLTAVSAVMRGRSTLCADWMVSGSGMTERPLSN